MKDAGDLSVSPPQRSATPSAGDPQGRRGAAMSCCEKSPRFGVLLEAPAHSSGATAQGSENGHGDAGTAERREHAATSVCEGLPQRPQRPWQRPVAPSGLGTIPVLMETHGRHLGRQETAARVAPATACPSAGSPAGRAMGSAARPLGEFKSTRPRRLMDGPGSMGGDMINKCYGPTLPAARLSAPVSADGRFDDSMPVSEPPT